MMSQSTSFSDVLLRTATSILSWTLVAGMSVWNCIAIVVFGYWLFWNARRLIFNKLIDTKGKSVLITGCDSGFGYLLAKKLAGDGFWVYAGCLESKSDGATKLRLAANVHVLQLDVTKEDDIEDAFRVISNGENGTALWAVVANAGVGSLGKLEWYSMAEIRHIFDVNIFGATSVVVKFLPLLKSRGRIVIMSSMFGCDTGFGYLLASQLAGEGFFTYAGCLDENSDGAKGLKKRANIRVLQMDVTKEEEIQRALEIVEDTLDGKVLWAVVANAGVSSLGYIEWQPMSRVRSVFDVNTFGTLAVTTAFLPLLRKAQGRLVIVTSTFASYTIPEFVTYSMSKHAVSSLAEGLRRQYFNRGVHVCTVAPGAFRTTMADHDKMNAEFDRDLELLPEKVRTSVDKKSVARFKRTAEILHNLFMRDDLQEAVDAMKMAVRERLPRAHYRPGGWLNGLTRWLHDITPAEIADEVIDATRRIAMLVKKK